MDTPPFASVNNRLRRVARVTDGRVLWTRGLGRSAGAAGAFAYVKTQEGSNSLEAFCAA